jgi:hypothetical protein
MYVAGSPARSSSFNLEAAREALPRILGVEPEPTARSERVPRRFFK